MYPKYPLLFLLCLLIACKSTASKKNSPLFFEFKEMYCFDNKFTSFETVSLFLYPIERNSDWNIEGVYKICVKVKKTNKEFSENCAFGIFETSSTDTLFLNKSLDLRFQKNLDLILCKSENATAHLNLQLDAQKYVFSFFKKTRQLLPVESLKLLQCDTLEHKPIINKYLDKITWWESGFLSRGFPQISNIRYSGGGSGTWYMTNRKVYEEIKKWSAEN